MTDPLQALLDDLRGYADRVEERSRRPALSSEAQAGREVDCNTAWFLRQLIHKHAPKSAAKSDWDSVVRDRTPRPADTSATSGGEERKGCDLCGFVFNYGCAHCHDVNGTWPEVGSTATDERVAGDGLQSGEVRS